jgi:hypothetical protein
LICDAGKVGIGVALLPISTPPCQVNSGQNSGEWSGIFVENTGGPAYIEVATSAGGGAGILVSNTYGSTTIIDINGILNSLSEFVSFCHWG